MAVSRTVPAALAGGSLLFADDSDAGFLTPGIRGARDAIEYDPMARGDKFLRMGISKAPDGSGMSTNDRLDTLIGAMEGMGRDEQLKFFTNYIHHKANYEKWGGEMLAADKGARSGENYKAGMDAFLEDILERRPQLKQVVEDYAIAGNGRGRLTRTSDQAADQHVKRKRHFKHNATRNPRGPKRRSAAAPGLLPVGQGSRPSSSYDQYQDARLHNREMEISEGLRSLGMEQDPMFEYRDFLPSKKNIVTGERSWAWPNVATDITKGLLGLGKAKDTGIYDVNDLFSAVL